MSSDRAQDDTVCQKAVTLIVDLCLADGELLAQDTCQDFFFLLSKQNSDHPEPGFFLCSSLTFPNCESFCIPDKTKILWLLWF
ncbi:unnamed protein product [Arctogadus glacialis]